MLIPHNGTPSTTLKNKKMNVYKIISLIFLLSLCGPIYSQEWTKSFEAGNSDINGQYMGGSEVLHLKCHNGSLYAAVGYWQDARNIWYGGTDPNTGWGQILRLDSPDGEWEVDLDMGPQHLRPEIIKEITFSTDGNGTALNESVTLLIAGAYTPALTSVTANAFTRNDQTGQWAKSAIFTGPTPGGENYSIRDFQVYRDSVTGIDRVFVTIGTKGIFSGIYDPGIPGKIKWDATPEIGPLTIRPLGIAAANGSLHFSSGEKIYKRTDGENPAYTIVHDLSDLSSTINSAVGGIRGLTTISNPTGTGDALLFMWSPDGKSQGIIFRLEPDGSGGYTRHREIQISDLMCDYINVNSITYLLGAYNEFMPVTGETEHIVGFECTTKEGTYPSWENGYYRGAMYAVRDENLDYRLEEVNGKISSNDPALVSVRCYTHSPFTNENAIYFGGHDPNGILSTNMAWVYKHTLPSEIIGDNHNAVSKNQPKITLHCNSAYITVSIKSPTAKQWNYRLTGINGKLILSGSTIENVHKLDMAKFSRGMYLFYIEGITYSKVFKILWL